MDYLCPCKQFNSFQTKQHMFGDYCCEILFGMFINVRFEKTEKKQMQKNQQARLDVLFMFNNGFYQN